MKLIEEKQSLWLQIISLIIVTVASVMGQIANSQIDAFSEKLLHERLKLNEVSTQAEAYRSAFDKYSLWLVIDAKVEIIEELLTDPNVNSNAKSIAKNFSAGEIDRREYLSQMKSHYRVLFLQYRKAIDERTQAFNQKYNSGSPWQWWRDLVFTPLQLVGIVVLIIGNSHLLLSISRRTNPRKAKR